MLSLRHAAGTSKISYSLELSAVGDHDGLLGLIVSVDGVSLNSIEDGHAVNALAEDDVSTVEMRGVSEAEEELGSVGAWASVGHGEDTASSVLVDEVLVSELASVDGRATGTVVSSEIAALGHEVGNDSVEGAVLEVEGNTLGVLSLLTSAESAEVLGADGSVSVELDGDATSCCSANGDVEEDLGMKCLCHGNNFLLCFIL